MEKNINNTEDWLEEYRRNLPLWERVLDKIPVIRRLRWIHYYYRNFKLVVKSWWQRTTRGYSDMECWNLDSSIAKWILPRLKHLRNKFNSCPPNLEINNIDLEVNKDKSFFTSEQWKDRLDKMIYAFEFVLIEDDIQEKCFPKDFEWGLNFGPADEKGGKELIFKDKRKPDYTYFGECLEKHQEGMKLFGLYFRHLWD